MRWRSRARWLVAPLAAGAVVALTLVFALTAPGPGSAWAQPGPGATEAVARLSAVEAWCGSDGVFLEGTLEVALPEGATTRSRYEVEGSGHRLDLGESSVPATAGTASTLPFLDDVWFGDRWVAGTPFTYRQRTVVAVGGVDAYTQVLEATCATAYSDAQISLQEWVGPDPTPPAPDPEPEPLVPRFAG